MDGEVLITHDDLETVVEPLTLSLNESGREYAGLADAGWVAQPEVINNTLP